MRQEPRAALPRAVGCMLLGLMVLTGAAAAQTTRVFVSSSTHTGDLGGIAGADMICQELGAAVDAGSTWRAFLSTSTTDAVDQLTTNGPFVRASDTSVIIADDLADLLDGDIDNPILLDESGNPVGPSAWTGSTDDGTTDPAGGHCTDWTTSQGGLPPQYSGAFGNPFISVEVPINSWIAHGFGECTNAFHLYCFEAPPLPEAPATPPIALALLAALLLGGGLFLMRRRDALG